LGTIEDFDLVKSSLMVEYELHSNKKWISFSTFKQPEHNGSYLGLLIPVILIEILGVVLFLNLFIFGDRYRQRWKTSATIACLKDDLNPFTAI
jgi:hypothetical protein